jgi:hypothetical protein
MLVSVASLLGKFLVTVETNVPKYFKKYIRISGDWRKRNHLEESDILFHLSMSSQDIPRRYYLRERSEASTPIFEFINQVENLTGKKVKSFKVTMLKNIIPGKFGISFAIKGFCMKNPLLIYMKQMEWQNGLIGLW